jgi:hypothetical protein
MFLFAQIAIAKIPFSGQHILIMAEKTLYSLSGVQSTLLQGSRHHL